MQTQTSAKPVILVVDDEPMILRLLAEILSRAGYPVISAPDANEALQICRKQDPRIALAIVDYIMPGQNGPELIERLKQLQPELRVLLMSGYTGVDRAPDSAVQFGFL